MSSGNVRNITYLILAHSDPTHLERLIAALGESANVVVHIDAGSDRQSFASVFLRKNVIEVDEAVKVNWGGWSMVEATRRLIETAIDQGFGETSSHFVLLSGADYPIKPVKHIHDFFDANRDRQLLKYIDISDSPEHYLKAVRKVFLQDRFPTRRGKWHEGFADKLIRRTITSLSSIFPKRLDLSVQFCFGSQWWALTPDCANFVADQVQKRNVVTKVLRTAQAPDELFFATTIANSKFASQSSGRQQYEGVGAYRLANVHHLNPSQKKFYTIDDFDEIAGSSKLFVRKVSTERSTELLDRIDRELR